MTKARFQTFDPDSNETPDEAEARLGAQLDQARAAWLDSRGPEGPDPDVADEHQKAMNEVRAARAHNRQGRDGISVQGERTD